ncbi:MAG: Ig-like domain-containing protein [Gemmatimonadota bacterium]|nr:Ig-like domain-containing protein [Gemmatimonadota bacterium]
MRPQAPNPSFSNVSSKRWPGLSTLGVSTLSLIAALLIGCGGDDPIGPTPPPDPARPTTVTVTPASTELTALGETVQLSAEVRDQNGRTMSGATVAWASSNPSVAAVDAPGLVTAASNGTATITASAGSASGSAGISVEQAVSAVRVAPETVILEVGDTVRLEATALDARDNAVPGVEFEWSSSDPTVATVDSAGLVRAASVGAATVNAASGAWQASSSAAVLSDSPVDHHAVLTTGLPERPFANTTVGGTEGSTTTVGTLRLGLNPNAFPVIADEGDMGLSLIVAGSRLGSGRVVAFSGQDFLGSDDRATLVGHEHADRLLANAVRWTGGFRPAPLRVLADNQRIADALAAQGLERVDVVGSRAGLAARDWSASALDGADVAVVQVNEWGTPHLLPESVAPLRAFVERGGGLVIAGSALHWRAWIERRHGAFTGNALLDGTGIGWNEDSIEAIRSASTRIDLSALTPSVVWGAYLLGERIDAARMALLPHLFSTALELGRTEELDSALVRLVTEAPPLPVSANAEEARLSAEIAGSLGPHEWPRPHPWATAFPGLPAPGASRERGSVVVDATGDEFPADAHRRERHFPLEFYAPPSGLVTISVPPSHATGDLSITVGQDHDDLRRIPAHTVWRRPPALLRTFRVKAAKTAVTNAFGGALALVVPESHRGTIPVTVEGAIPMAVYTAGKSNGADWFATLGAGAPQAIIQKTGGIRLVISAEGARSITDPGEVSAFWDGFLQHHAELAGGPVRAYESTWTFDPQVGYGLANAGWLTINYALEPEAWALLPGTAEGRRRIAKLPEDPTSDGADWWLFGHELGHQWQTEDWGSAWRGDTYAEIGEVAVNLFTMYTLNYYIFGGGDYTMKNNHHSATNSVDHAALANLRWPTADFFQRLSMYRQIIAEFGWDPMKSVFHSYYDPAWPRSTYGGALDGFAIRISAVLQRDLAGFFRHWEYPLSQSAEATIRSFGFDAWLPPGW